MPAGVEDGSTLRLVGRGEAAPQGGRAGNLYVILRVQADERFERDGADLHTEVAVSFPQLALGDTRRRFRRWTARREVDIPPGTQPGETIALRGRGMPRLDGRGHGRHRRAPQAGRAVVAVAPRRSRTCAPTPPAGGQRVSPERGGFFRRKKKK